MSGSRFSEGQLAMTNPSERRARQAAGRRWIVILLPLATLAGAGCYQKPTRWDEVQQQTRRNAPAVSKEAVAGSEFNKLFPRPEADFDVVFSQEKPGFAEADLKKEGKVVATLAISDTVSNPEAAEKYRDATARLKDYPMVDIGDTGSGVLIGDRFQVQVRSKDANFGKDEREQWLGKFDLANLAGLAKLQ
jgi:hypothetical protein